MVYYKTNEEIELLKESNLLVSKTLAEVAKLIQPGIKTLILDNIAEQFIRDHGAEPGFKGYNDFPNTLCVSINNQVVHGIPGDTVLRNGDVVSVDCGVLMNRFYGDAAYTFEVGEVEKEVLELLKVTKEALYKGIEMAVIGKRVGDIGFAIQQHTESNGFSVVRELVGHGVGKNLHEKPEIPNYGKRGSGTKLKQGMVLAIEPMINMGKHEVKKESDGFTITTADKLPSAHYEHTIAVRKEQAEILSTFQYIEKALHKDAPSKIKRETILV